MSPYTTNPGGGYLSRAWGALVEFVSTTTFKVGATTVAIAAATSWIFYVGMTAKEGITVGYVTDGAPEYYDGRPRAVRSDGALIDGGGSLPPTYWDAGGPTYKASTPIMVGNTVASPTGTDLNIAAGANLVFKTGGTARGGYNGAWWGITPSTGNFTFNGSIANTSTADTFTLQHNGSTWITDDGTTTALSRPTTLTKTAVADTTAAGLTSQNTTASLVGAQVQRSPAIYQVAHGWDVDGAVDVTVYAATQLLPIAGNTVTSAWLWLTCTAVGTCTEKGRLASDGSMTLAGDATVNGGDITLGNGSATNTISASTNIADDSIYIIGNTAAGNSTHGDVTIKSAATRTAGYIFDVMNNTGTRFRVGWSGGITASQGAVSSGVPPAMLTLSANGNSSSMTRGETPLAIIDFSGTKTWAAAGGAGPLAKQRLWRMDPVVAFAATTNAYTVTDAAVFAVSNPNPAGSNVTITNSWDAWFESDALGATQGAQSNQTNGILVSNETAAAAGAQQYSPIIVQRGYGWKTDATAASQAVEFATQTRPVEGTANPTGVFDWLKRVNMPTTTAWTTIMSLTTAGNLSTTGTIAAGTGGSENHAVCWKAGGVLGYCSDTVGAGGTCTCN